MGTQTQKTTYARESTQLCAEIFLLDHDFMVASPVYGVSRRTIVKAAKVRATLSLSARNNSTVQTRTKRCTSAGKQTSPVGKKTFLELKNNVQGDENPYEHPYEPARWISQALLKSGSFLLLFWYIGFLDAARIPILPECVCTCCRWLFLPRSLSPRIILHR